MSMVADTDEGDYDDDGEDMAKSFIIIHKFYIYFLNDFDTRIFFPFFYEFLRIHRVILDEFSSSV